MLLLLSLAPSHPNLLGASLLRYAVQNSATKHPEIQQNVPTVTPHVVAISAHSVGLSF